MELGIGLLNTLRCMAWYALLRRCGRDLGSCYIPWYCVCMDWIGLDHFALFELWRDDGWHGMHGMASDDLYRPR